jgi:hypothetical protein
VPCGIYAVVHDRGPVYVGTPAETAAFAMDADGQQALGAQQALGLRHQLGFVGAGGGVEGAHDGASAVCTCAQVVRPDEVPVAAVSDG